MYNRRFKVVGIACGFNGRFGTMRVTDFAGGFIEKQKGSTAGWDEFARYAAVSEELAGTGVPGMLQFS